MAFKLRKFYVWLISLGVVLAIYLLYNWISQTPPIDFETLAEFTDTLPEANVGEFDRETGTIGDVGVETVKKAKYIDFNKETKEVERVFGFEKLLHEEGDEWEIQKPYMDIFRPNFKCSITADRGKVRVENPRSGPSPEEGKLTGNVVIHILPRNSSDINESFIYLDDVYFVRERSQFSTAGPIKFISQDAQMVGRGLEFVYNTKLDRLEYLWIIHLDSLRSKTSKAVLFGTAKTGADRPTDAGSQTQTDQPDKPVTAGDSKRARPPSLAGAQAIRQSRGEYYKCVFSTDVVIDTPEQWIFADDQFTINDIFFSKASAEIPGKADSNAPADPNVHTASLTQPLEPNESSAQLIDVVVTCRDGILVTPTDSTTSLKDFARFERQPVSTKSKPPADSQDTTGRATLLAKKIDYSASSDEAVVLGPLELTFYPNDVMVPETNAAPVPVKVTARKQAKFLPAANQAVFEGGCECIMLRGSADARKKYTLLAPTLTVDLSRDKASAPDIEHLTAGPGVVKLASVDTTVDENSPPEEAQDPNSEKLLGGTELKFHRFDFDVAQQMFLATGPGAIRVYNSKTSEPNSQPDRFNLKKPSWTIIENFDTLQFFFETSQLIADAGPQEVLTIDYFPVIEGRVQRDQRVSATAVHVEANLIETIDGEYELSTLSATGGVTYEDKDRQFGGSELFYDAQDAIITVRGDQLQPCHFNGVPVDAIVWDLTTDSFRFEIVGPGAFEMKR